LANNLKLMSTTPNSYTNPVKHPDVKIKHKTPQKRASSLHSILMKEEYTAMRDGRNWPAFRAGDSIEIEVLSSYKVAIYAVLCLYQILSLL
jgi:hypothetical protein